MAVDNLKAATRASGLSGYFNYDRGRGPPTLSATKPKTFYRLSKPSINAYHSASLLSLLTSPARRQAEPTRVAIAGTAGDPHGQLREHWNGLTIQAAGPPPHGNTATPSRRPGRMWLVPEMVPSVNRANTSVVQPLGQQCSHCIRSKNGDWRHLPIYHDFYTKQVRSTEHSTVQCSAVQQCGLLSCQKCISLARKMGPHTRVCAWRARACVRATRPTPRSARLEISQSPETMHNQTTLSVTGKCLGVFVHTAYRHTKVSAAAIGCRHEICSSIECPPLGRGVLATLSGLAPRPTRSQSMI